MTTEILGATAALLTIAVVLRLVLRRRLLVKYAALWLAVSLVMVGVALVPGGLDSLSAILQFEVPANLLFFMGFVLLLFVTLQLCVELTKVEAQIQRLAEESAIETSRRDEGGPS